MGSSITFVVRSKNLPSYEAIIRIFHLLTAATDPLRFPNFYQFTRNLASHMHCETWIWFTSTPHLMVTTMCINWSSKNRYVRCLLGRITSRKLSGTIVDLLNWNPPPRADLSEIILRKNEWFLTAIGQPRTFVGHVVCPLPGASPARRHPLSKAWPN